MPKQKIDILLPYWGEFRLLKETVESVLQQTEKNWRLLVFDDAYPSDEARQYFKSLDDSRVIYYRHKKNIGITKNFDYALGAAETEYCVILGCDDRLLPNYLEIALNNIGTADLYQPGVEIIDMNGNSYFPMVDKIKHFLRPKKAGVYQGERIAATLCMGNWLYFPSIIWRTKLARQYGFDANHNDTQDVILELTLIKNGAKLFVDDKITFQYRRSAQSWSSRRKSKIGGRFDDEHEIYNFFAKEFQQEKWRWAALSARIHITSRIHRFLTSLKARLDKSA